MPTSSAPSSHEPPPERTLRTVTFRALEYGADQRVSWCELGLEGSPGTGWSVTRNGRPHLELGSGYRLLETRRCGVCSTDLDRHFLPFPLPQVTGHEVVARDDRSRRVVVEINASHVARGDAAPCATCAAGLDTHCPDRRVLGIHDLPGGFGPWILAPEAAVMPVPDAVPDDAAVLVEPFAAALHGVRRSEPREGDVVAVLGPRRLGMLVVAALAAERKRRDVPYEIVALVRHAALARRATLLGADRVVAVEGDGENLGAGMADLVFDTTASPAGFERALTLARGEVHLKSTHGRPAGGLVHPTELVVDEIGVAPVPDAATEGLAALERLGAHRPAGRPIVLWRSRAPCPRTGWLAERATILHTEDRGPGLERPVPPESPIARADVAVVDDAAGVDAVVRPDPASQTSWVRPRGEVWLTGAIAEEGGGTAVERAVAGRGLRLTTSRCGRFAPALALLASDRELAGRLATLVTHRFPADRLDAALVAARSPEAIKAVVEHPQPAG